MKCKFCNHEEKLIRAHIIPKSFLDFDRSDKWVPKYVTSAKEAKPRRSPTGIYDKTILCRECDNRFGVEFDEFAAKHLIRLEGATESTVGRGRTFLKFEIEDVRRFKNFFLSVAWRMSVSSQPLLSTINLGPWEASCLESIKGHQRALSQFSMLGFYWSDCTPPLFNPRFLRIDGVKFLEIFVHRYMVFIKVDKRRAPSFLSPVIFREETPVIFLGDKYGGSDHERASYDILRNFPELF